MKSVSFKAIALASVVVVGSAQATFTETVKSYVDTAKGYATSAQTEFVNAVNAADTKVFGKTEYAAYDVDGKGIFGKTTVKGFPGFNKLRNSNKYVRAGAVLATVAVAAVAVQQAYKYFTTPAVDENVEANNETVA